MAKTPEDIISNRNLILNGALHFWQRTGSSTTTINTAGGASYIADRFARRNFGATNKNYSIVRSTDVPTAAQAGYVLPFSNQFSCLTAITSPVAADAVAHFQYSMEGYDYSQIHGRTAILGFWVKSTKTGSFPVAFGNGTRSYVSSFTVNSANTWEQKSVTLTFESSGSYSFDNSLGLKITFAAGAVGSNSQAGSLNTWSAGDFYSTAALANIMDSNTNVIKITGIQLNLGATLAPFKLYGDSVNAELVGCQRYFEKSYDIDVIPGTIDVNGKFFSVLRSDGAFQMSVPFKQVKRATPSVTPYSDSSGASGKVEVSGPGDISVTPSAVGQFEFILSASGGTAPGTGAGHFTADAEL